MPVAANVQLGAGVVIFNEDLVNVYGCRIGDETRIGPFVEIQAGAVIGRRCKISSHSFICDGIEIGDEVFIGHGVVFTNDRRPRATGDDGQLLGNGDWTLEKTRVGDRASIGSGAIILPGVTIGDGAVIGAGSVVTRSVEANQIVVGNPARPIRQRE